MTTTMNGRSVGPPVFNNDTLDADKELHLFILTKSGLQIGLATASAITGHTTFLDLRRRTFWTTIQTLYQIGIVCLNRQVVNASWNPPYNKYDHLILYDIFVDAPLHILDIAFSFLVVGEDILNLLNLLIPPVPQVANMVVNPLVVQPIAQNIVALPPPLQSEVIDIAYISLYLGGSVGLWLGQIIKNGIDFNSG
jgi:hypothetical protein